MMDHANAEKLAICEQDMAREVRATWMREAGLSELEAGASGTAVLNLQDELEELYALDELQI